MNILQAGSAAEPHSRWHGRAYQKPIGHGRGRVSFLIVLSGACWWRGPRTCTPPPQNDYAVNWMYKQAVWEEFSRSMQHCCLPEKCQIQSTSCLFFSLNKCSDCKILLFNSSKALTPTSFLKLQHTYLVTHTLLYNNVWMKQGQKMDGWKENWILLHIKRFSLCHLKLTQEHTVWYSL